MNHFSSILNVLMGVIIAVAFILVKVTEGGRPCSQIRDITIVYPDGQEACLACPKCPPGQGLQVQCGSKVPNGTSTDCKPCKVNKTYSDSYDSSTCKPCNQCGLKNVLQHCTPRQNRKCGSSCPPEHYLDNHDDCTKCYFCCDDVPEHMRLKKCKDLGMPRNMQCERTRKNEMCQAFSQLTTTKPQINTTSTQLMVTTEKERSTAMKETPTSFNSGYSSNLSSYLLTNFGKPTIALAERDTKTPPAKDESDKSSWITLLIILIIFIIALVVVIAVAMVISKKTNSKNSDAERMGRLLDSKASPLDNSELSFIPPGKTLIDLPFDIEQTIKKLDANKRGLKNWRDVGCKFNIPEEDLDSAELEYHRPAGSPTKALLNILHTKYSVTLQRFVTVLHEIERNDIAHIICHYYKIHKLTTNRSHSSATIESYVTIPIPTTRVQDTKEVCGFFNRKVQVHHVNGSI